MFTEPLREEPVKWVIADSAGEIVANKRYCLDGEKEGWLKYTRYYYDGHTLVLVFTL